MQNEKDIFVICVPIIAVNGKEIFCKSHFVGYANTQGTRMTIMKNLT
jgi:hypothetical protein